MSVCCRISSHSPCRWVGLLTTPATRKGICTFEPRASFFAFYVTEGGGSADFNDGSEGVIGVAAFSGGESAPSQAVVLSAGCSYRLTADLLKREFGRDGPLPRLLLRYTMALISQMAQTVACNRYHSVDQQLCR